MTLNKLLKIIKKHNRWIQETPAVFGLSYEWMKGFTQVSKYYEKDYGVVVVPFKNDYGWHFLDKKKSIELAHHIFLQYQKDSSFLQNKMNIWKKNKQKFLAACNKIKKEKISKLSKEDLWKLYNRLMLTFANEFAPALFIEAFEPYISEVLSKKVLCKKSENFEKLSILEQPSIRSFIVDERIDFLRTYLEALQNSKLYLYLKKNKINQNLISTNFSGFYKKLKRHSEKFFWLKNNYKDIHFLSLTYFLNLVVKEIRTSDREEVEEEFRRLRLNSAKLRQKKRKIIKELGLPSKIVSVYKLFEILAQWQDKRKKMTLIGNFYVNELLKQIAKFKNLPLAEVQYMHPGEIKELLLSNKLVDKKTLLARRHFSVWIGTRDKEFWFTGEQAEKIREILFKETVIHRKVISGIPASPGTMIGKVRIVLNPQKDKFYKDEILVTSMTRPEYLPIMRKAKAIITDTGGITCHAAIVSRELKIPCVVGTKIATKALKDGDLVEVDANKGVVRIFKK